MFALGLMVLWLTASFPAHAQSGFDGRKFAAIVMDAATGEVLYARNADSRRYPASLTKVMTLLLAFEQLDTGKLKMSDTILLSPHAAARPPSKMGLRQGSRISVKDALNVIVVKSANDVAAALGEKLGGTEAGFAKIMTRRAHELGMSHTHFANASGLPDPNNVSTARDLAILTRHVQREHAQRYRLFNQQKTTFHGRVVPGHNRLLRMAGVDGVKTGFTNASGFNLISSGVRDGHRIIAVVMGGPTGARRDRYMKTLLSSAFQVMAARDEGETVRLAGLLAHPGAKPRAHHAAPAPRQLAKADVKPAPPAVAEAEVTQGDAAAPERIVQVGAFRSKALAGARLEAVQRDHPRHFADADGKLEAMDSLYFAQFTGFTPAEAGAACERLKASGEDCLVVTPDPS